MSTEINNQVVQMKFNNREFEKNVQETLTSLEKLDKSLQLKDASKGLDELADAAKKVDLSPLEKAADTVKVKFSALEIAAITALTNITNKAVNAGEKLVKSLSVDNVTDGWKKFEETTTSVGTLISQGFSMQEVEEQLEKLNWYTDETSYNFTDMVNNIGKFTATGQDLETSVKAMMGIANWAALSGQNATKASMAMYQLSQAMSKGVLKYDDWRSISNAAMDTKEFRQQAVEAAVAVGTLKKSTDGLYKTLKGHEVGLNQLFSSDYMSRDAWFTSDVMMTVFNKYSSAVDKLYEATHGLNAEYDTASEAIAAMGDSVDVFGLKAFRAAQEARTWTDVISSVKDAVSSKWKTTFEMLIGNYEEAKNLFTGLANMLYDVFAAGGEERNSVLALWKAFDGREKLLDGLAAGFYAIKNAVDAVKNAFYEVFSFVDQTKRIGARADKLVATTEKFRVVMYKIANFTERNAGNISSFFKGIFSVVNLVKEAIVGLFHAVLPVTNSTGSLFQIILGIAGAVGRMLSGFTEWIRETGVLTAIMGALQTVMSAIGKIFVVIVSLIAKFGKAVSNFVTYVKQLRPLRTVVTALSYAFAIVAASVLKLVDSVKELIVTLRSPELTAQSNNPVVKVLAWIKNAIETIGLVAVAAAKKIVEFVVSLSRISLKDIFEGIGGFFKNAQDWVITKVFGETEKEGKTLLDVVKKLADAFLELFKRLDTGTIVAGAFVVSMVGVSGALAKLLQSASGLFGNASSLFKTITGVLKKTYAKSAGILNIAEAFAILAGSLWVLSKIPTTKLQEVAVVVAQLLGILTLYFMGIMSLTKLIAKGEKLDQMKDLVASFAGLIKAMSLAIVVLSASLVILKHAELSWDLIGKLGLVVALLGVMSLIAVGMSKLLSTKILKGDKLKSINIVKLTGAIFAILALAVAINKISTALVNLSTIDSEQVMNGMKALVPLLIAFGALAVGVGQVKLTSIAGIFLLIKMLEMLIPELSELASKTNGLKVFADMFESNLQTFTDMLFELAACLLIVGIFGKNISAATKGISLVFLSIAALMATMALLNSKNFKIVTVQTLGAILVLGALIYELMRMSEYTKTGKLVALGGALLMMAPTLLAIGVLAKMLSSIVKEGESWPSIAAKFAGISLVIFTILGSIALIMKASARTKNIKIASTIAIFAGINMLIGELIALTLIAGGENGIKKLLASAGAIAILLGGLAAVVYSFGKLNDDSSEINGARKFFRHLGQLAETIIYLVAGIASLVAIYQILRKMQDMDPAVMTRSAIVLGGLLTVVSILTTGMAKISYIGDIKKNWSGVGIALVALASGVGSLFGIAAALSMLSKIPPDKLEVAGKVLERLLVVVGIMTAVLSVIAGIGKGAGIAGIAIAIIAIAAAIGVLVWGINSASDSFVNFANALTQIQNAVASDPIGSAIRQITEGISVITNNPEYFKQQFIQIGVYMVDGIVQGIDSKLDFAYQYGVLLGETVIKGTQDGADEHSPSRLQYQNGVYMVLGMCLGMTDNLGKAYNTGEALGEAGVAGAKDAISENLNNDEIVPAIEQVANGALDVTNLTVDQIKDKVKEGVKFTLDEMKDMTQAQRDALKEANSAMMKQNAGFKGWWKTNISDPLKGIGGNIKNASDFIADPAGTIEKSISKGTSSAVEKVEGYFKGMFGGDYGTGSGLSDIVDKATRNLEGMSTGLGSVASSAEKAKSSLSTLKDTIEQQMDIFSEFNLQTEITAEDMLHNMASNILGIQGWADNLAILAARGMDEGLLKKLGDMGPQAYEKVMAFAQMTDEQLLEANNLFRMSTKLPGSAANEVNASYKYAAEMAMQGFSNALDYYWALISPEAMGTKTLEDIEAGMTEYVEPLEETARGIGTSVSDIFNDSLPGEEDGKTSMENVAKGMLAGAEEVAEAALKAKQILSLSAKSSQMGSEGYNIQNGVLQGLYERSETYRNEINNRSKKAPVTTNKSEIVQMQVVPNLDRIRDLSSELNNAFGTNSVNLDVAAAGVNKAIEASRTMENKVLADAMKTASTINAKQIQDAMVEAITTTEKPINVHVSLEGDAQNLFKAIVQENSKFTRIYGRNALAT